LPHRYPESPITRPYHAISSLSSEGDPSEMRI
jgi:hypothetical protein